MAPARLAEQLDIMLQLQHLGISLVIHHVAGSAQLWLTPPTYCDYSTQLRYTSPTTSTTRCGSSLHHRQAATPRHTSSAHRRLPQQLGHGSSLCADYLDNSATALTSTLSTSATRGVNSELCADYLGNSAIALASPADHLKNSARPGLASPSPTTSTRLKKSILPRCQPCVQFT